MAKLIYNKKIQWPQLRELFCLVSNANKESAVIQDPRLLDKVCTLESTKPYIDQLEYQKMEGYCAPATLRCVLKSFPAFPAHRLPPAAHGPSDPHKWSTRIKDLAAADHDGQDDMQDGQGVPTFHTEIVEGDRGYDDFLDTVRKVNNPKYRVAINFLRPALVGFQSPWWVPIHLCLGLFGGHFSPVVGVLEEEEPLIAVFDVNAKWGLYLVRAKALYESVRARDLMTGKSRAVVAVSECQ